MWLILLALTSAILIVGVETVKRRFSLPTALTRRVIHAGTSIVATIAPLFISREEIIVVSIVFAAALLAGHRSRFFSAIHAVTRSTFGEVYLPLGVAIAALIFLPDNRSAFQFGVLVMGIADPLAGLIGEQFGTRRNQLLNNSKSLEGSLAFFISSLILTLLFASSGTPISSIILIPIVLTFVEHLLVYGLDNLALPIVAAYLIQTLTF